MRICEIIILVMTLFSFAVGIYFYSQMPEKMASHWNFKGEVDGYISKFWGLFLMPFILVGMALLFLAIPRIDPLKVNIEQFRKYYDGFIILFFILLFFIYIWIILWNIGIKISSNMILPFVFGILWFYLGILCENAKRNWFIGIRTPWTLSNEKVWEKTHKIAGLLFKIAGVISVIGVFFKNFAVYFVIIPVLLIAIYTVVYSYIEYQKNKNV